MSANSILKELFKKFWILILLFLDIFYCNTLFPPVNVLKHSLCSSSHFFLFFFKKIYTSYAFDREYTMFIEWRTKIKLSLQIIGFNGLNLLSSLLLCDCYNESIMLFCRGAMMCSVLTVDDVYRMTCFYNKLEIILELRGAL